jgi:hypothetical protein
MRLCVNRRNLRLIVDLVFVVAAVLRQAGASLSYGIRERHAKNQTQITPIVAEGNAALR